MTKWNSSPHPISDLRDWHQNGLLELRPAFQRQEVWSQSARIMLIDTILRGIPMPKIFLANRLQKTHTYRVVIDGQQRTTAILDFLSDKFALGEPYDGPYSGMIFSALEEEVQNQILTYQIDFNEAINPTDQEVREVYSRVNKYTVALTKQELRRADFPGDFLNVSEELANHPYFERAALFSAANRRRYADVEYISELLAALIDGAQDKKKTLDEYYTSLVSWPKEERKAIETVFRSTLDEVAAIFSDDLEISTTRFKQKADFYSLFLAISNFVRRNKSVKERDLTWLRMDLRGLDAMIAPEASVPIYSEYAIKCVSQANSHASRRWRQEFLSAFLPGTFGPTVPNERGAEVLYAIVDNSDEGFCPVPEEHCIHCGEEIHPYGPSKDDFVLAWHRNDFVYQLANAQWLHKSCISLSSNVVYIARPTKNDEQPRLL